MERCKMMTIFVAVFCGSLQATLHAEEIKSRPAKFAADQPTMRAIHAEPTLERKPSAHAADPLAWLDQEVECEAFVPPMLGDFIGAFSFGGTSKPNTQPRAIARSLNRFKVADNNSPRPETRFLYSYNHFHDAFESDGNIDRHFLGGEFAMFDRMASFEIRSSVNQFSDFGSASTTSKISDLRTTLKVLLVNRESAALAGGVSIGWPVSDAPGELNKDNYFFAPFAGYVRESASRRWYLQGFHQLDIPTEQRDQMVLHTDLGVGYFLRRNAEDRFIQMIAPTVELHLYTPIGEAEGIYRQLDYDDVLNATAGGTVMLRDGLVMATGISFPITNNKDYDVEFQFHLNWYFGPGR